MVSIYKGHTKRHERDHCRKNPERKSCFLCILYYEDFDYGPGCEDDRKDLQIGETNENNDCIFFKSKIIKN